jgi:hypothetical protein
MMLYEIAMTLAFITIFIVTHYVFKNIKDIFFWTCKLLTTVYLWLLLWIVTQLHRLPEWQSAFTDSVWTLVNMTKSEL